MNWKWVIAAGLAVSTVAYVAPVNEAEANVVKSFKDINPYSDMGNAIEKMAARGVMSGYKDGTFRPNVTATRIQVAKTLVAALQLNIYDITEEDQEMHVFKDVPQRSTNYKYIVALAKAGIINGYADGTFKPHKKVTRGEFVAMLQRAYDLNGSDQRVYFSDVQVDHDFYNAISVMYANDITKGVTSTKFGINEPVTRGQIALFLYRTEKALLNQPLYFNHEVTFKASELGYDGIYNVTTEGDVYKTMVLEDSSVRVKAINPGTARLSFTAYRTITEEDGWSHYEAEDFFYYVTVTKKRGLIYVEESPFTIHFERGNFEENVDFVTNTYHYGYDGLNLTFTPSDVVLKDDNSMPISYDDYFVELGDDEMKLTVYKAGSFQLHFSDEYGNQEVKVLQVYDQNFSRTSDIDDAKSELIFDVSNLGFEPTSFGFSSYDSWGEKPAHFELENGVLTGKAIGVGGGYLTVYGEYGQRQKIYIYGQESVGLLYLNSDL